MPRTRYRLGVPAAMVGALLTALVAAFAVASGGAAVSSAVSADAATTCKFAGKRYVGKTSQNKRLCFTLAADGKRVREYAYDFRDSCGGGSSRTTIKGGISLATNGSFASKGTQGTFFKGFVKGGTASGTMRSKRQTVLPGTIPQFVTCDSGVVRWNARKASG